MIWLLLLVPLVTAQFFPLTKNGDIPKQIQPYETGQHILMDCISRNIDNGEHKMDSLERIIYIPFPSCKETNQPLTFKYGVNEDFNCTITFDDELYHLFQFYIHEDNPFSCRIPLSTEQNYLEKGGAAIPLTFNFRGEIHESHLDVDPYMNVLFTTPNSGTKTVISSVAYGASTNATRVVIGDDFPIHFSVKWFENVNPTGSITESYSKNNGLPFTDGFYQIPITLMSNTSFIAYMLIVAVISSLATMGFTRNINRLKSRYLPMDHESSLEKRD